MPTNQTFLIGGTSLIYGFDGTLTTAKLTNSATPANISEIACEQIFPMDAYGLKPNTLHKFYFGGVDVSSSCMPIGGKLGDGLITDLSGKISFNFHFIKDLQTINVTEQIAWEQAKQLFSGSKAALLTTDDKSSFCSCTIDSSLAQSAENWFTTTPVLNGLLFNLGQTFYIDPSAIGGSSTVCLSSIVLYFREKPIPLNNPSGQLSPGVTIYIVPTDPNNVPIQTSLISGSFARQEYNFINTSFDASTPTIFSFGHPLPLNSRAFYGIMIAFDSPDFSLWYSKTGDRLLGTNQISSGPAGKYIGAYYEMGSDGTLTSKTDTDLKFTVNIAEYIADKITVNLEPLEFEFINFDGVSNTFLGGEPIYQDFGGTTSSNLSANVTFYSKGIVNVNSNATQVCILTGTGTTFTNGITGFVGGDYIVLTDGTAANTSICGINKVVNDTVLILQTPPSFTANSIFYKKTVIGSIFTINYMNSTIITCNSTANTTVQWTPTAIKTVNIVAGGTGYNNGDYVVISGGGSSVNAQLNVFTNATGGIIGLNYVNAGVGFTGSGIGTSTLAIKAANGVASNGSTANLVQMIGSTLRGTISGNYCNVDSLYDFRVDHFTPEILVKVPDISIQNTYVDFANTGYVVDATREFEATIDQIIDSPFDSYILSRTNEVNTPNSQLAGIPFNASNTYSHFRSAYMKVILNINQTNTLSFTSPYIYREKLDLVAFQNDINNSDYLEETNNGNCRSKHISTSITFSNNQYAPDLRVYFTAYKPLGTNVEIFAKILNSNDPDTFENKLWTPLQVKSGSGLVSSSINTTDFIQYMVGFSLYPKSLFTCPGTANVSSGNSVILTTTNLTSNLSVGDLVKIYNPTPGFSNGDYFITVVNVVNATAINVSSSTANVSLTQSGMFIDKIGPYDKFTAYSDLQNSNTVTYFNSNMVEYTTFNTVAIKILLLSNTSYVVPRVTDVRVLGVGMANSA